VEKLTKEDVLNREELILKQGDPMSSFSMQGDWGNNFFWKGEKCYIPVIFKGERRKMRVRLSLPMSD